MSKAVRNIYSLKNNKNSKISIIILAAEMPSRMTGFISRLFVDVEGKKILDRYIAAFNKNISEYELIVVGGFSAQLLYDNLPNDVIFVNHQRYTETHDATSLKLGVMAATTGNILVLDDNLVFNDNLLAGIDFSQSFVISETNGFKKEQLGLTKDKDWLENLSYDLLEKWTGIVYITGQEYQNLRNSLPNIEDRTFLFELINKIGKFKVHQKNKQVRNFTNKKETL